MIIFLSITHFFKSLAKCACKKVVRSEMCLRPSVPAVPTLLTPVHHTRNHTITYTNIFYFHIETVISRHIHSTQVRTEVMTILRKQFHTMTQI
jgi:hypothetical protein